MNFSFISPLGVCSMCMCVWGGVCSMCMCVCEIHPLSFLPSISLSSSSPLPFLLPLLFLSLSTLPLPASSFSPSPTLSHSTSPPPYLTFLFSSFSKKKWIIFIQMSSTTSTTAKTSAFSKSPLPANPVCECREC